METFHYAILNSPVGQLTLVVSERGLTAIEFERWALQAGKRSKSVHVEDAAAVMPYVRELQAYFRGELRTFTVPLDLRGTGFQKQCWQALLEIPYGQTRTYADIARAIARPTAFRAVGMANHSNPVPIIVPCHRVLASNGTLCGYGGGLDVKRKLLEFEGAWPTAQPMLDYCATTP